MAIAHTVIRSTKIARYFFEWKWAIAEERLLSKSPLLSRDMLLEEEKALSITPWSVELRVWAKFEAHKFLFVHYEHKERNIVEYKFH